MSSSQWNHCILQGVSARFAKMSCILYYSNATRSQIHRHFVIINEEDYNRLASAARELIPFTIFESVNLFMLAYDPRRRGWPAQINSQRL